MIIKKIILKKIQIDSNAKALIFDLDGTIANSMPLHFVAWKKAAAVMGLEYTTEFLLSCAGMPCKKIIAKMNKDLNQDINENEFSLLKDSFFKEELVKVEGISAVVDLIHEYHNKLPMAVGTGGKRYFANKTLEYLNLTEYFPVVICAEDVENHKPFPDTFLRCASLLGVQAKDCIVFEDAVLGIQAAKSAGMQCIDVIPYY